MANESTLGDWVGWPGVLGILMGGGDLDSQQAAAALSSILSGEATPSQIAAFCVALRVKGETVAEMAGMRDAMMARALSVALPLGSRIIDTCGTGGDRSGSINVSTLAAFVVAGAGAGVCKHGNRAASSVCGSADVLEALGVAIDLGPDEVAVCISEAGMGFCLAPRFHPGMRHAGPTRRELGVPTVFNFLGPLANPAPIQGQVVGVSDPRMAQRMLGVLQAAGLGRAMVVYGHDGLDELTITTTSTVFELSDGIVRNYDVDPSDLGLAVAERGSLRGGSVSVNAEAVRRVLDGEMGFHRDVVCLNAAAAAVVAGLAESLVEGIELAFVSIDGGAAADVLDRLVRVSQRVVSTAANSG
ncbi:MAG: anthranilate phosphoribosyltransferase [Pseudonocardiaceae bacterium]